MNAARKIVGFAQDRPYNWVGPAVQTLRRERWELREIALPKAPLCVRVRSLGEMVQRKECDACAIFCEDAGLAACVLNKLPQLRAVAVMTVAQAALATLTLSANVFVIEMPGRTYFEVRQILRELCESQLPCPDTVAGTLQELTGHAHR